MPRVSAPTTTAMALSSQRLQRARYPLRVFRHLVGSSVALRKTTRTSVMDTTLALQLTQQLWACVVSRALQLPSVGPTLLCQVPTRWAMVAERAGCIPSWERRGLHQGGSQERWLHRVQFHLVTELASCFLRPTRVVWEWIRVFKRQSRGSVHPFLMGTVRFPWEPTISREVSLSSAQTTTLAVAIHVLTLSEVFCLPPLSSLSSFASHTTVLPFKCTTLFLSD